MTYYVEYRLHSAGEVKGICVAAGNKVGAWDLATYVHIPAKEGSHPYSAWVASVTYKNGNYREFDTHEGRPY